MTVAELMRRLVVAARAPALGQHVLFLFVWLHRREPPDFPKITGVVGVGRHHPISRRQFNPIVNLISKRYYLIRGDHVSARNG